MHFEDGAIYYEGEINGKDIHVDIYQDDQGNCSGVVDIGQHTYKAENNEVYGVDNIEANFTDLFNALVALDDGEDCGPGMMLATALAPYIDN